MKKPISTRAHGIIDYGWAATATALSKRVNGATSTARLLRFAASSAMASSLVTDYECGAVRVVPMRGHLAIDLALCGALLASPLFLPRSERRYAVAPVVLGALGLVTGLLTQTRAAPAFQEEFGGLFGGGVASEADQDPDIALAPHLRQHLE